MDKNNNIQLVESAEVRATIIPNEPLDDNTISLKAKGLYAVIMHTGRISVTNLCKVLKEGRSSVSNTLEELEENGYLEKTEIRDASGRFEGYKGKLLLGIRQGQEDEDDSSSYEIPVFFEPLLDNENLKKQASYDLPFYNMAKELADCIEDVFSISIPPKRQTNWAGDLEKLHRIDGVSVDRIEKAIKGYKKIAGKKYTPLVQGGSSFRSKFLKLEDAINREIGGKDDTPVSEDVVVEYDKLGNKWVNGGLVYE